jgi:hypothetical protein
MPNNQNLSIKRLDLIFWLVIATAVSLFLLGSYDKVIAQSLSKKIMVDNFEIPGNRNSLGGSFGAFADKEGLGHCYLFFTKNKQKDVLGDSKYSLYIQWDTSTNGAYGGYWTELKHLNLENFNYLTFYAKGIKGGEEFKVGLRGKLDETYETKILISELLGRKLSTQWQKVIIPLSMFQALTNRKDVNILSFNFEHAFTSGKGSVLIDEIAFEK